ncbi:hypothetical protein U0070_002429 [Myodes glareolus]|uniref:Uncharacterized protein n=1 Tax=Myodes glareolus TaxID=447135 RepID=A0AAW0HBQ4_MYOGA
MKEEKRKHKKKRLVQSPNSFFMDVKCPGCYKIITVFSHAQTVVLSRKVSIQTDWIPKNPEYAEETSPRVIVNGFLERLRISHIQGIQSPPENLLNGWGTGQDRESKQAGPFMSLMLQNGTHVDNCIHRKPEKAWERLEPLPNLRLVQWRANCIEGSENFVEFLLKSQQRACEVPGQQVALILYQNINLEGCGVPGVAETPTSRPPHVIGRLEHPNPEEVEEIDCKHNMMKVLETIKQDVKNSFKGMDEKTNKKLKEMNKSLKDTQENQEKTIKQTITASMNKWNLLKLRSFCKAKDTVIKTKRLPSDWEKIFTNPSSDKGFPKLFIMFGFGSLYLRLSFKEQSGFPALWEVQGPPPPSRSRKGSQGFLPCGKFKFVPPPSRSRKITFLKLVTKVLFLIRSLTHS